MVQVSEKPISKEKYGMICTFLFKCMCDETMQSDIGLHSFIFLNSINS